MPQGMKRIFASPLTEMSTTAKEELGTLRREGNKLYKYVQFDGTGAGAVVAVAAGDPVVYEDYANNVVHADVSAGPGGTHSCPAGQAQAAWDGVQTAAAVRYGWIQVEGLSLVFPSNFGGAPGIFDTLFMNKTNDKALQLRAAADAPTAGVATNVTGGSCQCILTCPR